MDNISNLDSDMKLLASSILKLTQSEDICSTLIPGLTVFKKIQPTTITGFYEPSVCLIAQGAKHVQLGEESYQYDTKHYLFSGVHLPVVASVSDASTERPYLGLKLTFDYHEIAQLMTDSQLPPPKGQRSKRGMATGSLTAPLINAFQRLIDLVDEESNVPTLAPMVRKEIFYRLLIGEQGETLRQLAVMGTQSHQVAKAIAWLKSNFSKSIRIEDLAQIANMGVSTFHHHFRNMTAISPLQYIKQIRLQEARRLMLSEHLDAATSAFQVGYESPSQFCREYGRLYGRSPAKDVSELRSKLAQIGK